MVRTLHLQDHARPEPARIAAIAAAIAVHVFAFLLLLLPLARSTVDAPSAPPMQLRWEIPETIVTPPLPPEPVEQPSVQPPRPTPRATFSEPQVAPPAVLEQGTLQATAIEATAIDPGPLEVAVDSGPLAGAQLRYARAPAPSYPRAEARAGIEGTVLLRVLVDVDGSPIEVSLEKSSGNRSLDAQARSQVLKHWRFEPAMRNGRPVQAYGLVPIEFSLQ